MRRPCAVCPMPSSSFLSSSSSSSWLSIGLFILPGLFMSLVCSAQQQEEAVFDGSALVICRQFPGLEACQTAPALAMAPPAAAMEKRKSAYMRFGKRKSAYMRFGKRAQGGEAEESRVAMDNEEEAANGQMEKRKSAYMRFGKRKSAYMRFGRK